MLDLGMLHPSMIYKFVILRNLHKSQQPFGRLQLLDCNQIASIWALQSRASSSWPSKCSSSNWVDRSRWETFSCCERWSTWTPIKQLQRWSISTVHWTQCSISCWFSNEFQWTSIEGFDSNGLELPNGINHVEPKTSIEVCYSQNF